MTYSVGDLGFINLHTKEIKRKSCPDDVIKSFLGGRGLCDYLLINYLGKKVKPLDAENILIFANGWLTGTNMLTSGRLHISARSPLTGYLGTSNSGGTFAPEMRACGILALIVIGKSEKPVYINIKGGQITLEDASSVWGLKTTSACEKIKELINDNKAKIVVIGPAGENLTSFGAVMTGDGYFAGRTGMGTVMGSKNLKGIAVRKTINSRNNVFPHARQAVRDYLKKLKESEYWGKFTTVGSSCSLSETAEDGAQGTKNFNDIKFDGVATADGSAFKDSIVKYKACYNCPIHCKADIKINDGRHKGLIADRPEYGSFAAWGPKCGNADGRESIYLNNLCNEYGIDTIETGNIIGFAMDLYDKGIISREDTGGLELNWGNIYAMEELIHQIANRSTRFGKILAQGVKEASEIIGKGSEKYAFHVKGLGMTIMDPRGYKGTGLGFAVSSRGGDFSYIYAKPEYSYSPERALKEFGTEKAANRLLEDGKAAMVRECMCANAVIDSLGVCKIPEFTMLDDFNLELIAKIVTAISGDEYTGEDLLSIGERIVNAERLFNFRFGATGKDDKLPEKFLKEPIQNGPCKGSVINLEPMLKEFYSLMGWKKDGAVSKEKLKELGLDKILNIKNNVL